MAEKEMTLRMKIAARTREARRELQLFNRQLSRMGAVAGSANRAVSGAFRGMGRVASSLLRPAKFAVVGLTAATMLWTAASVKAYATQEALKTRLEAVSSTAKEAAADFKDVVKFSGATPFSLNDLVEAKILLKGIGVTGPASLRSTANAAAAMGREASELAVVVASLETEPLRRLGINLRRDGSKAVFEFRDKMGQIQTITANGSAAARKALLGIFDLKYTGAVEKLSTTLMGRFSTLKDAGSLAAASFGKGFSEGADLGGTMAALSDSMNAMMDSGKLEDSGKRFGEWVRNAALDLAAGVMTVRDVMTELKESGPIAAGQFVGDLMLAAAKVFTMALVTGVSAATTVFVTIARVMAAAFKEEMYKMNEVPGMSFARDAAARKNLEKISPAELKAMGLNLDKFGIAESNLNLSKNQQKDVMFALTGDARAKLAAYNTDPSASAAVALAAAKKSLTEDSAGLAAYAKGQFSGIRTPGGNLGMSFEDRFAGNRAVAASATEKFTEQGFIVVEKKRRVPFTAPVLNDAGNKIGVQGGMREESYYENHAATRNAYEEGSDFAGGKAKNFIGYKQAGITISRLVINNSSSTFETVVDRLVRKSGALPAGGGI